MTVRIVVGDALAQLKTLPDESVQCCVTSPPYWGLRDYGVAAQLGLEKTPDEYVANMVAVFREVKRVLRRDGTFWLNIGDSYAANRSYQVTDSKHVAVGNTMASRVPDGLKSKDLIGIPWMLAFALRGDGWYLRSDIIWHKPNPMPESVTDRPTKAHEYVFLLSKFSTYHYDAKAIAEPLSEDRAPSRKANKNGVGGRARSGNKERVMGADRGRPGSHLGSNVPWEDDGSGRNKRTVWTIPVQPFSGSHFATMPPELAETCIKAGCPEGGTVLDPFGGAGTTGLVADRLSRNALLIELNPAYAEMARARIQNDNPMFATVTLDGAA